ncbi:flavin reductase family protein [Mameliella alba]|uniref:Flavin reductase domain protein, FMN-binding n=1 Tax=Mameliella alba TaxID=561184 RepID=A0A0B3RX77_9RHOB|nr:flavin reductase family protein [Mameliella alba]KHQ51333.1 Flavin reductase domain protein, FMN-binding [Mameliella alba]
MFHDPRHDAHGLAHGPWMALIAPRPIAWISTVSAEGVRNLAPYSAFNTVASKPPFVMFASDGPKDTLANIEASGEFCVNIPGDDLKEAMNATSGSYPPEVDEFAIAGVTPAPCTNIDAPRVAEAPISIECRLDKIVGLDTSTGVPCHNRVVFGEVVGIHIADRILRDGKVATDLLRPLARLGYRDYCTVTETFEMIRPQVDQTGTRT